MQPLFQQAIEHFMIVWRVAWPLNESGAHIVGWKPPCFSYVNDGILTLICRNLDNKRSEVFIKTRSTPESISFKRQATV